MTVYITAIHMTGGNRAEHIDCVRWLDPADGKTDESTREAMVDWIDKKNGAAKVGSSTGPVAVETIHPAARPERYVAVRFVVEFQTHAADPTRRIDVNAPESSPLHSAAVVTFRR